MTNYIELYESLLSNQIKPLLKSHGYNKAGQHFYQKKPGFIKFISIVRSSWNSQSDFRFWFVIHVFDEIAYKYLGESEKLPKVPYNSRFSIIELSISDLRKDKDQAYELNNLSAIEAICHKVISDITGYILPFLGKFQDKKDLLNEYESVGDESWRAKGAKLYSGLHQYDYGDKKVGINRIDDCAESWKQNEYWSKLLQELKGKMLKNEA